MVVRFEQIQPQLCVYPQVSEMGILFYLLVITGSPWWADGSATGDFSKTYAGPLVTYVGRFASNGNAGPPCWCNFWSCAYCPGDTYCTVDESGCCPEPGCWNGCGRWCLCPDYPVCCPDGACTEDNPTCCGRYCCKSDGNCCEGEHCCEAGNSCCGKGCCPEDNGQCCTSTTDKETVCCFKDDMQLEEDYRNKDDEKETMDTADENIFKYICDVFKTTEQYAVLVVGRLSATFKLDPMPSQPATYDSGGMCIGKNYAAAKFMGGEHTEVKILPYADNMINEYKAKYKGNPELFLFSKNSPCCGSPLAPNCPAGCAGVIHAKLTELTGIITSMVIAWDKNYKLGAQPFDKAFLFSLNSMLSSENAQLSWNADGYCRKSQRNWFQETMNKCLLTTAQSHPFCTEENVGKDLAKLINKVTWICGTTSTIEDEHYLDTSVYDDEGAEEFGEILLGGPPARDPECWKKNVALLDANVCSQLSDKAFDCATNMKSRDLGPALQPSNPSLFSNSAVDVRGEYGNLCFQSGSCKAPEDVQVKEHKFDERKTSESKNEL